MKKLSFLGLLAMAAVALAACSDNDPDDGDGGEETQAARVILNEINGNGSDAEKFIELINVGQQDADLAGYTIYYNNFSSDPALSWTGRGQTLAAGERLLLRGTKSDENSGHDLATGLSATQGIVVELRDAQGATADVFSIGPDADRANSYARIPDGTGSWYLADQAGTPGQANPGSASGLTSIAVLPVVHGFSATPELPTADQGVSISAEIKTSYGTTVSSAVVEWSLDGAAQSNIATTEDDGVYSAAIPAQVLGSRVEYSFTVTNSAGGTSCTEGSYTVSTGTVEKTGRVYINECDPDAKQWELWNSEYHAVDLSGWQMWKDNGDGKFTFEDGTVIGPRGYLVLTRNASGSPTFGMSQTSGFRYDLFDGEGTAVDVFDNFADNQINGDVAVGHTLGRVTDGAERIAMFSEGSVGAANTEGTLLEVLMVYMGTGWRSPATPSVNDDITVKANISFHEPITSIALVYSVNSGSDNSVGMTSSNGGLTWTAVIPGIGIPGEVTYRFAVTPGGTVHPEDNKFTVVAGAVDYSALVINEVDGNNKFVEIYNNSDEDVLLAGVWLDKNEGREWWKGGSDAVIRARGFYTIVQNDSSVWNNDNASASEFTGYNGISAQQNLQFDLYDPDNNVLDTFLRSNGGGLGDTCAPRYDRADQGGVYSFSRCPDGSGEFGLAVPSCNAPNPAVSDGPILAN